MYVCIKNEKSHKHQLKISKDADVKKGIWT